MGPDAADSFTQGLTGAGARASQANEPIYLTAPCCLLHITHEKENGPPVGTRIDFDLLTPRLASTTDRLQKKLPNELRRKETRVDIVINMLVGSQRLLAGLSLVLFAAPTLALITNRDDSDIPATVKDAIIAGQSTPHFGSDDIFWSPTRLSAEQLGLLSEKGDQSSPPVVYDGKNNNIAPGPVPAAAVPVPRSNVIEPADRIKRSQVTREKLIARNARPKRRGTPQNSPTPQYVCDPPVLITGTVPYAIRQGFFYTGGPETIQYVFNDPTIKNLGDCMDRCAATPSESSPFEIQSSVGQLCAP